MNALVNPTLDQLASEINAEHAAAERTARKAIEHAKTAGEKLLIAKAQVEHGQWLPWLAEHCPDVAVRTAQSYMRLAGNWATLETKYADSAHLSIDAALKLLNAPEHAKLSEKRPPAPPTKCATPTVATVATVTDESNWFDAAVLNIQPTAEQKSVKTLQDEYLAFSDAARRKAQGLPEPVAEPEGLDLGFLNEAMTDDSEPLRAECERLRDELVQVTRSRDFWKNKVRDKETRKQWEIQDTEHREFMARLKIEQPEQYEEFTHKQAEQASTFANMFNLRQAMPVEIWRRLIQLVHPDKHSGNVAAIEATQWLIENRPAQPTLEAQP